MGNIPVVHDYPDRTHEFLNAMSEILVKVENVSKKFCRSLKLSLWYGMQDLGKELLGRRHGGNGELRPNEFWAVKDVSFELRRGECLGLIGSNGAGKTTLLRMLNGLIKPDSGRIEMRGRVGAMIALGAGFNPILTGRENIYVNASILGLSNREINEKLERIIDFADIGEFIDAPVQSYSTGMAVRLGFAVASTLDPDIMILDEVLSVGDMKFQAKCFNVLSALRKKGTAFVLVSHNMFTMNKYSTKILYLKSGLCHFYGDPEVAIARYSDDMTTKPLQKKNYLCEQAGSAKIQFTEIRFINKAGCEITTANVGEELSLCIKYSFSDIAVLQPFYIGVEISSLDGIVLYKSKSRINEIMYRDQKQFGECRLRFLNFQFNSKVLLFCISIYDRDTHEINAWIDRIALEVKKDEFCLGLFDPAVEWSYQ